MVTIQSFICSEAKGQLEGHEVSLNNRFLEVICVFPFGDLVEKKKKNRSQFEQYYILDDIHLRSSRKLPQVRFIGDLRR